MMKAPRTLKILVRLGLLIIFFQAGKGSFAAMSEDFHFDFRLSTEYDDNIYLSPSELEKRDYLTLYSLEAAFLPPVSERSKKKIEYQFEYSDFHLNHISSFWKHNFLLDYARKVSNNMLWKWKNRFTVRQARFPPDKYVRDTAGLDLNFRSGATTFLRIGYQFDFKRFSNNRDREYSMNTGRFMVKKKLGPTSNFKWYYEFNLKRFSSMLIPDGNKRRDHIDRWGVRLAKIFGRTTVASAEIQYRVVNSNHNDFDYTNPRVSILTVHEFYPGWTWYFYSHFETKYYGERQIRGNTGENQKDRGTNAWNKFVYSIKNDLSLNFSHQYRKNNSNDRVYSYSNNRYSLYLSYRF